MAVKRCKIIKNKNEPLSILGNSTTLYCASICQAISTCASFYFSKGAPGTASSCELAGSVEMSATPPTSPKTVYSFNFTGVVPKDLPNKSSSLPAALSVNEFRLCSALFKRINDVRQMTLL
jgi:hypothetical protein